MWIGIGIAGIFGATHLRDSYLESTRQTVAAESRLVSSLVDPLLQRNDESSLRRQVRELGATIHHRVTIVATDGRVIADSEADIGTMDNHRLRPEIVAAASQGDGTSTPYSDTT